MWEYMPPTLRRLFRLTRQSRFGVGQYHLTDGEIGSGLLVQLGLDRATAYRLLEPRKPPPRFRYRHFTIPKRDGTRRELVEPGPGLKAVQRTIGQRILRKLTVHPAALGFRRGGSTADHAWAHAGADLIITADIADFFPNTRRWRVKAWWAQQGYTEAEVQLLTNVTTYRGMLPQGAPTSPPLSNLINADLDASLDHDARASGGHYTRYADDLAFSWPAGYAPSASFEDTIRARLRACGYTLHPDKGWQVWQRRDEPEITGLRLTRQGSVAIPAEMQHTMKRLRHTQDAEDKRRLEGYRAYQRMVSRDGRG